MNDATVARAALEVQNVMGRYVATNGGADFAERVLRLFDLEDPAVAIKISDGPVLEGPAAVRGYWEMLEGILERNGGALGAHMLTSPVIEVSDDGQSAEGQWQDVGTTLFGPGMGVEPLAEGHKYSLVREASRYTVSFNRTADGWRIRTLRWDVLWTSPAEVVDEDRFWLADTNQALPQPPR